jgi:hypothetical protein
MKTWPISPNFPLSESEKAQIALKQAEHSTFYFLLSRSTTVVVKEKLYGRNLEQKK